MARSDRSLTAAALIFLLLMPRLAAAGPAPYVPDSLSAWVPWVLQDQDQRACPLGSDGGRVCAWPGPLSLDLDESSGRFEQPWQLDAEDWVPLPGDGSRWPQDVTDGERAVAVVKHDGRPAVRLQAGAHTLSGRFRWPRRPEGLELPPETGLVSLRLDGAEVARPRLDGQGRLWLGAGAEHESGPAEPDTLTLEVSRRIDDDIPLRVATLLALDVSGRTREVRLGPVPLPGGIPLRVDSPLPARLDDKGMLQVQVRPGRWLLTVDAHHRQPVTELGLAGRPAPWPEQEVWAFAAHPDLRQVEISGVDAVDPHQTRLPADWQRLPAYLLRPGMTMALEPLRRGALGADRLRLDRDLWLDYRADGFSLRDRIRGQLEQSWRLDVEPVLQLGQVRVGGEPRFITALPDERGPRRVGVEVRQGRLDLLADARIARGPIGLSADPPVSGWALQFDSIATRLHLPPGWDLLAVDGVDNLPNTWLARWSLLDIFLVLVSALAVGRLWGLGWGLLALLTLVLIWQEPEAPRFVWLNVLVAAALLRVVPGDSPRPAFARLRWLLGLYYRVALLALALIALPFLVTEMRDGLFPQLARTGAAVGNLSPELTRADQTAPAADAYESLPYGGAIREKAERMRKTLGSGASVAKPLPTVEPGALVQTGAGVPDWSWRSFDLRWSGPVAPDHRVRLWLLPPAAALLLALARVVLVLLLGLRLADWLQLPRWSSTPAFAVALVAVFTMGLGGPSRDVLAEPAADTTAQPAALEPTGAFPPASLLSELEQRLLRPPDCLPRCAEIPLLTLDASAAELRLLLAVDAAEAVALPIPGAAGGWRPSEVRLDDQSLGRLRRGADGRLLVPIPPGRHRLVLTGPLPAAAQVEIPLPLRPRLVQASVAAPWRLDGVDAGGRPADQLRLLRQAPAADDAAAGPEPSVLPPLLRVTRTLRLGLDWTVETNVERLSPPESPVSLRVPLIPGEAVTSAEGQVSDGRILVSLPPGRQETGWVSTLRPVDRLALTATDDPRLTEEWRVEASPLWHLESSGVAAVQNLGAADLWLPTWRPWAGETLQLTLSRPAGVAGPTLTLDRSRYAITPARRASEAALALTLRSSQGGRHRILLPQGAELTGLSIDGQQRPLALQGRALDLPLVPGSQQVEINWREPSGLTRVYRPAALDLGTPGVNAETQVRLGSDRWILWASGPGVGPAVQFWGLLVVLALVALLLSRLRLTPLGFVDWLLLGIGLSQVGVWVAALVTLWLFALGLRRRLIAEIPAWRFNLVQVGLALLTIAALLSLLAAVEQGLLGSPEMQIAGNGSSAGNLQWYLDRHAAQIVPVTVVSVSIWVYRALMLAWALWLAVRLLGWLRWGWQGFADPVLWRETPPKPAQPPYGGSAVGPRNDDLSVDL